MLNKLLIPEVDFTFDTDKDYFNARFSGYIPDYNMARITRTHLDGTFADYPCHSKEELFGEVKRLIDFPELESVVVYPSVHYYDINDYE